jgi:hypothetical protein
MIHSSLATNQKRPFTHSNSFIVTMHRIFTALLFFVAHTSAPFARAFPVVPGSPSSSSTTRISTTTTTTCSSQHRLNHQGRGAERGGQPCRLHQGGDDAHPFDGERDEAMFPPRNYYDQARKHFEQVILGNKGRTAAIEGSSSSATQIPEGEPPLVEAVGPSLHHTERMQEIECQLLLSLQDSNEAIDLLVDLWRNEGGPQHAERLERMEESCSVGLFREEEELRSMIEEFRHRWAEPMVRLALLLFTRGDYEGASRWCQSALNQKPWHVEAAQLLLVVYLRRGDYAQAVRLARHQTLPDLRASTNHQRRTAWVQRQSRLAEERLEATRRDIRSTSSSDDQKNQRNNDDDCPIGEVCWG